MAIRTRPSLLLRFATRKQLDIIKRAAKMTGRSLNSFIITYTEMRAGEILQEASERKQAALAEPEQLAV